MFQRAQGCQWCGVGSCLASAEAAGAPHPSCFSTCSDGLGLNSEAHPSRKDTVPTFQPPGGNPVPSTAPEVPNPKVKTRPLSPTEVCCCYRKAGGGGEPLSVFFFKRQRNHKLFLMYLLTCKMGTCCPAAMKANPEPTPGGKCQKISSS